MPIKVKCPNGHLLAIKDELAGKRIRCPKCEHTVLVPGVEDLFSGVFDESIKPTNKLDDGMPEFVSPTFVPQRPAEPNAVGSQMNQKSPATVKLSKAEGSQKQDKIQEKHDRNFVSYYGIRIGIPLVSAIALGSFLFWLAGSDKQQTIGVLKTENQQTITSNGTSDAALPHPDRIGPRNNPQITMHKTLPPRVEMYPNGAQDNQTKLPKDAVIITRDVTGNIESQASMPEIKQESDLRPDLTNDPQGLVRYPLDSSAIAYQLPTLSCSSAYDSETGILAFTDDTKGVVFHSIEELLEGKTEPKQVLPVVGLPGAMTMKIHKDQRLFVCSQTGDSELSLIDTKTLELRKKIKFSEDFVIGSMASSLDPEDPYVYFTKAQRTSSGEYVHQGGRGISRINLNDEKTEGNYAQSFDGLSVSPDGKTIFATTSKTIYGTWDEVLNDRLLDRKITSLGSSKTNFIDNEFVEQGEVHIPAFIKYQGSKDYVLAILEKGENFGFVGLTYFKSIPIVVGLSKNKLILGSITNKNNRVEFKIPTNDENYSKRFFDPRKSREEDRFPLNHFGSSDSRRAYADDNRKLAIFITGNHLVIVPLAESDLSQPHPLHFQPNLPKKVDLGSTVEIQVPQLTRSSNVEISIEDNEEKIQEIVNLENRISVRLIDDGEKGQSFYYVSPIEAFLKRPVPYQIRIGNESMTVEKVETQSHLIHVKRTSDIVHTISEDVVFLDEPKKEENLAIYENGIIQWTPKVEQVGFKNLILRATLGSETRSWYWPVEVVHPSQPTDGFDEFDFYVRGINAIPDTQLAIVWGISNRSHDLCASQKKKGLSRPFSDEGILAIYDISNKQILRKTAVTFEIDTAIYHSTGIYASTRNFAPDPKGIEPEVTTVVRFEVETLRQRNHRNLGKDTMLFLQVDNHLVAICERSFSYRDDRDRIFKGMGYRQNLSELDYRLKLPSLDDAIPPSQTDFPIDGVVETGPIKNGILWDKKVQTPKLLVYPYAFTDYCAHYNALVLEGNMSLSVVRCMFDGPNSSFLSSPMWQWRPGLKVPGRNIVLKSQLDGLSVFSNSFEPHVPREFATDEPLAFIKYPKRSHTSESSATKNAFSNDTDTFDPEVHRGGYNEAICGDFVFSTSLGKVYRTPLDLFPKESPNFVFREKQSRFVIEAGKKTKLEYSAEGADKYKLQIYLNAIRGTLVERMEQNETYLNRVKVVELESKNGQFEVEFDVETVANSIFTCASRENVERFMKNEKPTPPTREEFMSAIKKIAVPYKELTGKNPTTLPAIATAIVTASHKDGRQTAGMLHAYLVEVPAKTLLKKIESR
jgi:hypothetical protein